MSRNMVTVLIFVSLFTAYKTSEWLYYEVVDKSAGIDSQDWEERQLSNRQAIQALKIGDSLDDVAANMGTADFNEIKPVEDKRYQVLYYRTHHVKEDGKTTKDECTPLIFENQSLIGWGHEFYNFTFQESSETPAAV